MSSIGCLALLTSVLLTSAVRSGAASSATGKPAEPRVGLQESASSATGLGLAVPQRSSWNEEADSAMTTQLLAQNQQPAAAAADQAAPAEEGLDLSDQVIHDVFVPMQRGIQGHDLEQVLAIFDRQGTPDYAQLRDQLRAFFEQHDSIRFRYQLLQVTSDKKQASAIAEIEMDAVPVDPSQVTLRRDTQMRFRVMLSPKGWKLVGFTPADSFTQ